MIGEQTGHMVLNQFPRDQYNVLIPVQSLQAISAMQKVVINRVELDTRLDRVGKPVGKDIYQERNGEYAITKVGGMKLAAAANISIDHTERSTPEACKRCFELASATKIVPSCGSCSSRYSASYTVTIRVPELSGGIRFLSSSKDTDIELEKSRMTENQFREYLPNAAAQTESKAFMRALRMALGLQGTYSLSDIQKPFVVAHVVPDLDNPMIQKMAAQNMLYGMGLLYKFPGVAPHASLPAAVADDGPQPAQLPLPQGDSQLPAHDEQEEMPDFLLPICEGCNSMIQPSGSWTAERIEQYSRKHYGRPLCPACQKDMSYAAKGGARV